MRVKHEIYHLIIQRARSFKFKLTNTTIRHRQLQEKKTLSARRKMHQKNVIYQVTATTETTSETYTPYSQMEANKLFFCLHVKGPFAAGVT